MNPDTASRRGRYSQQRRCFMAFRRRRRSVRFRRSRRPMRGRRRVKLLRIGYRM